MFSKFRFSMSDESKTVNIVVDETPEKDINDNEEKIDCLL